MRYDLWDDTHKPKGRLRNVNHSSVENKKVRAILKVKEWSSLLKKIFHRLSI